MNDSNVGNTVAEGYWGGRTEIFTFTAAMLKIRPKETEHNPCVKMSFVTCPRAYLITLFSTNIFSKFISLCIFCLNWLSSSTKRLSFCVHVDFHENRFLTLKIIVVSAAEEPTVEAPNITSTAPPPPVIVEVLTPPDKRPSAIFFGTVAIILLISLLVLLVLADVPAFRLVSTSKQMA